MTQPYHLTIVNNGNQDWMFYVYQKEPNRKQSNVFSLAWLVSPYRLHRGAKVKFDWTLDYSFIWDHVGKQLEPGITVTSSGEKRCRLSESNGMTFKATPAPVLSVSTRQADDIGTLFISDDSDVPPNTFTVGIGMSGRGTFVQQAGPRLLHKFTPTPAYWVAAGVDVKVGDVLDVQTITTTAEVKFPQNVFSMIVTLNSDNTWSVEPY